MKLDTKKLTKKYYLKTLATENGNIFYFSVGCIRFSTDNDGNLIDARCGTSPIFWNGAKFVNDVGSASTELNLASKKFSKLICR